MTMPLSDHRNPGLRTDIRRKILEASIEQVFRTLRPERVLIAYQVNPGESLHLACQRGFVGNVQLSSADVSMSTILAVFEGGGSQNCVEHSVPTEATSSMTFSGLRSVLCAPILVPGGEVIGVIYADDKRSVGAFGKEHLDWLIRIGKALGINAIREPVVSESPTRTLDELWKQHRSSGLQALKRADLGCAETDMREALSCCRRGDLGPLALARTLSDLSEIVRMQGRLDEAQGLIEECIDLTESRLGLECRSTIPFYNNLAGLLYAQGRVSEAEDVYCQILERVDGGESEHWGRAIPVLANLGTLCLRSGQVDRAVLYHQKAVRMATELWGDTDPITQRCIERLEACQKLSA
jgi:Tfp pilus assembly protein PilF